VELVDQESDFVITKAAISKALNAKTRSNCHQDLNDADKVSRKTFHTNPPYLAQEAALFLRESGIQHFD
jgi:hypothetical protein